MATSPASCLAARRPDHRWTRSAGAIVVLMLAAVSWCPAALAGPLVEYQVRLFSELGGPASAGRAINERGDVVGSRYTESSWFTPSLWTAEGQQITLGNVREGDPRGVAYGVNDVGQSVGHGYDTPALWNGRQAVALPSLGGSEAYALAINNAGQSVGYSWITDNSASHAVLWNGVTPMDLGGLGGTYSWATAINDSGTVAGASEVLPGNGSLTHATLWAGGVAQDLGTLGFEASWLWGINNAGHAVGAALALEEGRSRAIWWDGHGLSFLSSSSDQATAADINNRGLIVGHDGYHATLWDGGAATDLNSFLDAAAVQAGWVLSEAVAVNDKGWITGMAVNAAHGMESGFLLTPVPAVPEPASALLAVVGLLTLGAAARRRPPG